MEYYLSKAKKISLNDYPHDATMYYPYGYIEAFCTERKDSDGIYVINLTFNKPHENEYMVIQDLDESRSGPFTLFCTGSDEPFAIMIGEMWKGKIVGFCEIYDEEKGKLFEGTWEQGKRCGSCIEYEFNSVSFQGAYRNDKRNGYGWEYHNNELQREGLWVDGVFQERYSLTKQSNWISSGLGMLIYRSEDDIIIVSSPWEDNKPNGQAYSYSLNHNKVISSSFYLHGDEVDETPVISTQSTISEIIWANGCRWKGEVVQGEATGEGEISLENGVVLYRGKMFKNMRYGQGIGYYMTGEVEYEGMWAYDCWMGTGQKLDKNGNIENSGYFIENEFCSPIMTMSIDDEFCLSHTMLEQIIIGDNVLNDMIDIDFSLFVLLRELMIGDDSLKDISDVTLKGLQCLERVVVGRGSMTQCLNILSPMGVEIETRGRTITLNENRIKSERKRFVVSDCGMIRSIVLKQGACSDFYGFVCENVPMLEELMIGEVIESKLDKDCSFNFYYANELEIRNLPKLRTLVLGNRSFNSALVCRLHDLTSLQSIEIGDRSLFGKKIRYQDDTPVCGSRCSWRNLPEVTKLTFHNNFIFYRNMIIEGMMKCEEITVNSQCFPSDDGQIELMNVSDAVKDNIIYKEKR